MARQQSAPMQKSLETLNKKLASEKNADKKKEIEANIAKINDDMAKTIEQIKEKIADAKVVGELHALEDIIYDVYGDGEIGQEIQELLDLKSEELAPKEPVPAKEGWIPCTMEEVKSAEKMHKLIGFNPENMTMKVKK